MKPELKTLPRIDGYGVVERAPSMRKCRFKRTVYRIRWDEGLGRWLVKVGGMVVGIAVSKIGAVDFAKDKARAHWTFGIPSQVWVANKTTGEFSKTAEATFGYDPKASKG